MPLLGSNPPHLAGLQSKKSRENKWYEGGQVQHPVRRGVHKHHSEWLSGQRLLELEAAIHRNESIETPGDGAAEELAVFHAFPPEPFYRFYVVSAKFGHEVNGKILIKKDPHESKLHHARSPAQRSPGRE